MREPDDSEPDDREPVSATSTQVMLAEYAALRTEVERRANTQWSVFALQLASAGAIGSVAVAATADSAVLLLVPLSSYLLGSRYILHDFHIKLIRRYLRESLSERLADDIRWETWRTEALAGPTTRGWFSVTGWNFVHSTRLAFEGVGMLAVLCAGFAGVYRWSQRAPAWPVAVGYAVGWLLGVGVVLLLRRAFRRASDL
ncbi:hypothetical protein [Amycolatopsis sp. lyj-23]|uniref:hypothetical protein n=1 Tax=Amycolatopsis sp. lyj-23 TaxID=2789283 RepID=UPI00397E8A63